MTPSGPSRRAFLTQAIAAGAAGLLAACTADDKAGNRVSPPSSSDQASTPSTAPAARRGLVGTITVSYSDELGKKPPYVEKAAAALRQEHPDATVKIDLHRVSVSDFYARLLLALNAGDGPDVIHIGGDRIGELADAGYITPLDDYVKDWPDWRYYPPAVREGVTYQGRLWAIPYGLDTRFLYFRRDIFARAGLSAEWQPGNVAGMLAAAATIKAQMRDVIPYVLYGGPAGDAGTANHAFVPLLWAYGGELQDQSGKWIGDSPAIRNTLAYYAQAFVTDRLVPAEVLTAPRPWVAMRERLGGGGLALLFEGGWVYGGWASRDRAATEENVGYLLHPTERGGPSFTVGGPGTCWYIAAGSRHKDLAWEFIKTWNNRDTVAHLNVADPHPAARADAVQVPAFRSEQFLVDSTNSLEKARFTPPDANYGKVVGAIQQATGRVAAGETGPEEAAQRYADDLRQALGADKVVTQA